MDPSVAANISATFYDLTGTAVSTVTRTVNPNLGTTVDQSAAGGGLDSFTSWQGAVVLSSTLPLASVVQELSGNTSSLGTGFRSDVYNGVPNTSAATRVLLPQLIKNVCDPSVNSCYYSTIAIQNTNPTTIANATLTYKNWDGQTYTHSNISIPPNSSVFINMADELPSVSAFNAPGVLTSDQPVAAIVNHNIAGALLTYQGFTSAKSATKLFIPQLLKNIGDPTTQQLYQSGFLVMVFDGSSANVTVTYNNFLNNHVIVTSGVANPMTGWDQRYDPALAGEPYFAGSAVVESTKPIVGIVNFVTNYAPGLGIRNTSYAAFPDGSGTTRVFFPLVMKNYFDSGTNVTWGTGVAARVMNGQAATATITYYSGGTTYTSTQSVSAGQALFGWDQRYDPNLPSPFYGSAVIMSTQPIVANMNIVGQPTDPGDALGTYLGINQ